MTSGAMTVTPEGRQALENELRELYARRPQMIEQIVTSRDEAELAESTPYIQAREEQALVEGRIVQIESLLRAAEVAEPARSGAVELGSRVLVKEGQGETVFHIVDPFAVDPAARGGSASSPRSAGPCSAPGRGPRWWP